MTHEIFHTHLKSQQVARVYHKQLETRVLGPDWQTEHGGTTLYGPETSVLYNTLACSVAHQRIHQEWCCWCSSCGRPIASKTVACNVFWPYLNVNCINSREKNIFFLKKSLCFVSPINLHLQNGTDSDHMWFAAIVKNLLKDRYQKLWCHY